jgi:uncharacterized membrane protein YhaH (DUF805 family)
MSKKRRSFTETYHEIINSKQFKRDTYVRRLTGLYAVLFVLIAIVLSFLCTKFFNISAYMTSGLFGFIAFAFAVLLAEKKAAEKFDHN